MIGKRNLFAPQLILFLLMLPLCMTYFVENVVLFQNIIYILVFVLYLISPKENIKRRNSGFYIFFLLFIILYIFRAFLELYILGHKQFLYSSDSTVLYFMLNGMLFPAIFATRMKIDIRSNHFLFLIGLVIACSLLISLINIFNGNIIFTGDQRIQANERLGVIQYGHLGLSAVIIGALILNERHKKIYKYSAFVFIFLGMISMFMAGTRGALISLIIITTFYVYANANMRTFIMILIGIGILYLIIENLVGYLDSIGSNSAIRIFNLFTKEGDQSSGRTDIWIDAINEIIHSPMSGVSCFLNSHRADITYVHNSFIEVTYALGIFGLIIFGKANYIALKTCISIMRSKNTIMMALSALYLQYLSYSMFSESIIRLPLYWVFLCVMLNCNFHTNIYKYQNE